MSRALVYEPRGAVQIRRGLCHVARLAHRHHLQRAETLFYAWHTITADR